MEGRPRVQVGRRTRGQEGQVTRGGMGLGGEVGQLWVAFCRGVVG